MACLSHVKRETMSYDFLCMLHAFDNSQHTVKIQEKYVNKSFITFIQVRCIGFISPIWLYNVCISGDNNLFSGFIDLIFVAFCSSLSSVELNVC